LPASQSLSRRASRRRRHSTPSASAQFHPEDRHRRRAAWSISASAATIDGKINPTLTVYEGELVQINLINGEGAEHDIFVDQYNAKSSSVVGKNASATISFQANKPGEFAYFCTIAGTGRPAWKA
jgi:heme/copper-type cytochrome/quinol oxidase subunit 2